MSKPVPASHSKRSKNAAGASRRTASGRVKAGSSARKTKTSSQRAKAKAADEAASRKKSSRKTASGRVKSAAAGDDIKISTKKKARSSRDKVRSRRTPSGRIVDTKAEQRYLAEEEDKPRKSRSSTKSRSSKSSKAKTASKASKPKKKAAESTRRFTKTDLLSDSDLDLQLLESGSGELEAKPSIAARDDLLLPDDDHEEVDIVIPEKASSKRSKKKSSGRSESAKSSAPAKKSSRAASGKKSRTSGGSPSRRRSRVSAGTGSSSINPMMFISIGLGVLIVALIGFIVVKKLTVKPGEDHSVELREARELFEEAQQIYSDVGKATTPEAKQRLVDKGLKTIKACNRKYNELQENPIYANEVEEEVWEWKETYSRLEQEHEAVSTLMKDFSAAKGFD